MRIIGDAPRDKNNGSKRVRYQCECGFIGTTRESRAAKQRWCAACSVKKARLQVNEYVVKGDFAYIDVSTEKFPEAVCVIDVKNLPLVLDGAGRWYASNFNSAVIYAVRSQRGIKMHRHILGSSVASVDHLDGNGLNNTEANLRAGSHSENMRNRRLDSRNKSGVVGVCFDKQTGLWLAQGGANGKKYRLGRYARLEDAAAARRAFEAEHCFGKNHGRAV